MIDVFAAVAIVIAMSSLLINTRNTCIAEPREARGGEPIMGGRTGEK